MNSPGVRASKQGLASVKKKLDANEAKQDAIRLEMSRLQAELDALQSERSGTLAIEYEKASTNHSWSWCLDFAQTIAERLPRELRDMVYGYLLDEDKQHNLICIEPICTELPASYTIEPDCEDLTAAYAGGSRAYVYSYHHAQHSTSSTLPHYLMAESMGTEIGGEIGEAFYTHSGFLIDHVDDLYPFLTNGPLDMPDLARPMDSIRHLTIAISLRPTPPTTHVGRSCNQKRRPQKATFSRRSCRSPTSPT
jgi:hypothetical protein